MKTVLRDATNNPFAIPDSLRQLYEHKNAYYDPSHGYTVLDARELPPSKTELWEEEQRRHILQKEANFSNLTKDIKDMSMKEYAAHRQELGISSGGLLTKTKYDKWLDAREAYAKGTGTIDEVLKYVEMEEKKYDDVYQYRQRRSRWTPWRWLVRWWHRRNLGRHRHWQDDVGAALR